MSNIKKRRTGIINDVWESWKSCLTSLFRDSTEKLAKEAAEETNRRLKRRK